MSISRSTKTLTYSLSASFWAKVCISGKLVPAERTVSGTSENGP